MSNEETNYAFGEKNIKTKIVENRVSPDEIIDIGKAIWQKVKMAKIKLDDHKANDDLLDTLQKEYKDFSFSFPIVLRWMVQMQKFSLKAFKRFLLQHAGKQIDSREDFLKMQCEYLVLLFRETANHPEEKQVASYRENIVKTLLEEDKMFLDMHKEVEAELEVKEKDNDRERRAVLYELLLAEKVKKEKTAQPVLSEVAAATTE